MGIMLDSTRIAPQVYVAHLTPFAAMLRAMGHDSRQALDSCGLPADLFQAPGTAQAPLSAYFRLCEYVCVRAGDETLRVSQRPLLVGASDLVQARLHDCRTVEQALNAVATVYNILHGSKYNLVLRRAGQIAYIIDDSGFPYAPGHDAQFVMFTLECLLVLLHVILASMAEAPLAPHALRTRRPPAQGHQPHLDYWGAPIRYAADSYAVFYSASAAAIPIDAGHSAILSARTVYGGVARALEHMAPPEPGERSVAQKVLALMGQGAAAQEEVAQLLGCSVATLRRRLTEENTSYRDLRAEHLNMAARRMLAEGMSLADTADALGFSDARSFARAFHAWNEITPHQYRETLSPVPSNF